jgi:gliding motility-associated-like protein
LYNPLAKPASSTQYIVSGINNFGCTASDTVFITVNPIPVVTVRIDTTVCHDTPVQLWAQGGNIYSWQPAATLSNPLTSNPVAAPLQNTTYTVTVTDANQCTARAAVNITVIPPPVFSVTGNATVCLGTPVQLEAKGGDRYTWTPAADLSDPSAANPVASPASLGANTYQVKINSDVCADSTLLSVAVVILPVPEITATKSNDIDCTLPFSQLSASGAEYYTWSPAAGLNDSTIANPLGKPTVTTTYLVKGIAANGCPGTDSVTIKVSKTGDLLFNMPNAFTPNGDGHNDCFGAGRYAALVSSIELSVYNRWGNLVFHTTNPNDCWDGTYKGKPQDTGGFPFIIKAKTLCGEIIKKGIVILVR